MSIRGVLYQQISSELDGLSQVYSGLIANVQVNLEMPTPTAHNPLHQEKLHQIHAVFVDKVKNIAQILEHCSHFHNAIKTLFHQNLEKEEGNKKTVHAPDLLNMWLFISAQAFKEIQKLQNEAVDLKTEIDRLSFKSIPTKKEVNTLTSQQ